MQRAVLPQTILSSFCFFLFAPTALSRTQDIGAELSGEQLYWEGVRCWEGWGGMVDTKKARAFHDAASAQGELKSKAWKLRREFEKACGDLKHLEKIRSDFSWIQDGLSRMAEKGDSEAAFVLILHRIQLDSPAISESEIQALKNKADQGDLRADRNLALLYAQGKGVPKSPEKALAHIQKAVQGGSSWAMNSLAWHYLEGDRVPKDVARAYALYLQSASQGNEKAQNQVGWMLREGVGTEKDLAQSVRWFQEAAMRGQVEAMEHLGWSYEWGLGVSPDPVKAFELYQQSADLGNAGAMTQTGRCLWNGTGVGKDRKEAFAWFERAAAGGNPKGLTWVGYCHDTGQEVPRDLAKAKESYQKAAEKGDLSAVEWMGSFYENGKSGSQDLKEAARWYEKGAEKENLACLRGLLRTTWPKANDPLEKERWKAWYSRTPEAKYPYQKTSKENGSQVLQTATRTLRSREGAEVCLVGVCHIGEKDYYEGIQARLDQMPLVLYEGLGLPDFFSRNPTTDPERAKWTAECGQAVAELIAEYRKITGRWPGTFSDLVDSAGRIGVPKFYIQKIERNGWGLPWNFDFSAEPPGLRSHDPRGGEVRVSIPIAAKDEARRQANQTSSKGSRQLVAGRPKDLGDLMQDFAELMGLTYQFDQLDYNRPSFLHCDQPVDQVLPQQAAQEKAGKNQKGPISQMVEAGNQPTFPVTLAALQLLPNAGELMRSIMIAQFSSELSMANALIYGDFKGGSQEMRNVLFVRNNHLIRAIKTEMKKNPKGRFGVIYGSLHLPEVEQVLVEKMGMSPMETNWLTAIRQKHSPE